MERSINQEPRVYIVDDETKTLEVAESSGKEIPGQLDEMSVTSAILKGSGLKPWGGESPADGLLQLSMQKPPKGRIADLYSARWMRSSSGFWSYLVL